MAQNPTHQSLSPEQLTKAYEENTNNIREASRLEVDSVKKAAQANEARIEKQFNAAYESLKQEAQTEIEKRDKALQQLSKSVEAANELNKLLATAVHLTLSPEATEEQKDLAKAQVLRRQASDRRLLAAQEEAEADRLTQKHRS